MAVTTWAPAASVIVDSAVTIEWPPSVLTLATRERGGELVAGHDRAAVAEALVAVHDPAEVDAGVGLGEQLGERGLLHHDGEGRRGDDVGMARRHARPPGRG